MDKKTLGLLVLVALVAAFLLTSQGVGTYASKNALIYYEFISTYSPAYSDQSSYGRGPGPAALSIKFLNRYYDFCGSTSSPSQEAVKAKIKSLADYLISIQYTADASRPWYGGFPSMEGGLLYYSIDATFSGEALIHAYNLLAERKYLDAAIKAATFLRTMQTQNSRGIVDAYYGGFCEYVRSDNGAFLTRMYVKLLLALPFLKMLYMATNDKTYMTMAQDARGFLVSGLVLYNMYYSPKPYGDDKWHRTDEAGTLVIADSVAYALRGLYEYEGLTDTIRTIYDYMQGCTGPNYDPRFAWTGYVDVVHRTGGQYYDVATGGILAPIRKVIDRASLEYFQSRIVALGPTGFNWGLDLGYSPLSTSYYHTNTVADIGYGVLEGASLTDQAASFFSDPARSLIVALLAISAVYVITRRRR